MSDTLADRIERRLLNLPANNPGVISFHPTTLQNVMSRELIRRIATEAAAECQAAS